AQARPWGEIREVAEGQQGAPAHHPRSHHEPDARSIHDSSSATTRKDAKGYISPWPPATFAGAVDRARYTPSLLPKEAIMHTYRMLVDGEWVPARTGRTSEVANPATAEPLATVPDGGAEDVDLAVKAARRAFDGAWHEVTAQERGRVLFRLADTVRREAKRLAALETLNSGKPIAESEFDIGDAATCFEYYGGLATKLHGEVLTVPDNALSLALKEPVGVAAQVIPWNYPLLMAAWKLAPAICAGCSMVIKPAEQTPVTLLELARFFEECGLPKGVVNVVTGFGETAGAPLV